MRQTCLFALLLSIAGAGLGQERTVEHPFPETGTQSEFAAFGTSMPVEMTGVITQEIRRPDQASTTYLFFRINVRGQDGRTTNWAVRIYDAKLSSYAFRLALINDYTPEMSRLKVGMTVKVKGYPSKDSTRLLLIPVAGSGTIAGIIVPGI